MIDFKYSCTLASIVLEEYYLGIMTDLSGIIILLLLLVPGQIQTSTITNGTTY